MSEWSTISACHPRSVYKTHILEGLFKESALKLTLSNCTSQSISHDLHRTKFLSIGRGGECAVILSNGLMHAYLRSKLMINRKLDKLSAHTFSPSPYPEVPCLDKVFDIITIPES